MCGVWRVHLRASGIANWPSKQIKAKVDKIDKEEKEAYSAAFEHGEYDRVCVINARMATEIIKAKNTPEQKKKPSKRLKNSKIGNIAMITPMLLITLG